VAASVRKRKRLCATNRLCQTGGRSEVLKTHTKRPGHLGTFILRQGKLAYVAQRPRFGLDRKVHDVLLFLELVFLELGRCRMAV